MSHQNPFHKILLDFVSDKTEHPSGDAELQCIEKTPCVPTHINNLVGYAVLRDRWVDLGEVNFTDPNMCVDSDGMQFPCGWCAPCENGVPLLWNHETGDFSITPGVLAIPYECDCFPLDYCDAGYGLLWNFETNEFSIAPGAVYVTEVCDCFPLEFCDPAYGLLWDFEEEKFNMAPGIVNLCDVCNNAMMYNFSRCRFNQRVVQLPQRVVFWKGEDDVQSFR